MATATKHMATEELLAMPQSDGTDRWLIDGELREQPMTVRNRYHSYTVVRTARFLDEWRDGQPEPRGKVFAGDAGVRLPGEPQSTFGIDVVYVAADLLAAQPANSTIIHGVPTLAAEVLSPSDTVESINEKITVLLQAGVPLIWIIDTFQRTVIVYTPDADPVIYGVNQEMSSEPNLPGFRIPVRQLFE